MTTYYGQTPAGMTPGMLPAMGDHRQAQPVGEPKGVYGGAPGEFELTPRIFWPTTMFSRKYRDHARDVDSIIEYLYELKNQQKKNIDSGVAPTMKSKDGLYESHFDLFTQTKHEGLLRLVRFIESSIRRAVWHVNGKSMDPNRIQVKFLDSWYHITNGSGFHDAHYHGGCSWCGVYYLQISDISDDVPDHAPNGVNRFYSPIGFGGNHSDYGNAYMSMGHVDVPPTPGDLVLFPSYLLHSGLPYKGAKDRVILSFNSVSDVLPESTATNQQG